MMKRSVRIERHGDHRAEAPRVGRPRRPRRRKALLATAALGIGLVGVGVGSSRPRRALRLTR